jgi:hypothetical protein
MEVSDQLHALVALPPGKEHLVPIGEEAGWAPELVWATWRKQNLAPAGIRTPGYQPVTRRSLRSIQEIWGNLLIHLPRFYSAMEGRSHWIFHLATWLGVFRVHSLLSYQSWTKHAVISTILRRSHMSHESPWDVCKQQTAHATYATHYALMYWVFYIGIQTGAPISDARLLACV